MAGARGPALEAGLPLANFAAALGAARLEATPESIHALRSHAAKFEARLWLCGRRALRDDLRSLRRACSALRDLDACPPRGVAADELRARRAEHAKEFAKALANRDLDALCAGLAFVPDVELSAALARLAALERRFAREGRAAWREEDPEALHALRRRARRIRDAREWLGLDAARFARAHVALGRWHDLVAAGELDAAIVTDALRDAKAAWRAAARAADAAGGPA